MWFCTQAISIHIKPFFSGGLQPTYPFSGILKSIYSRVNVIGSQLNKPHVFGKWGGQRSTQTEHRTNQQVRSVFLIAFFLHKYEMQ